MPPNTTSDILNEFLTQQDPNSFGGNEVSNNEVSANLRNVQVPQRASISLPNPTTQDARERFNEAQQTTQKLNQLTRNGAGAVANANTAMDGILSSGLPAPANLAAQALSVGIYTALSAKPIPVDITRASSIGAGTGSRIDPRKLFASMIAFAIIQAIWCFIKSLLNPLPFIGSFFPLCSPTASRIGPNQNLIPDEDQIQANRGNQNFIEQNQPGEIDFTVIPVPTPPPIPEKTMGKTFSQFIAENYSQETQVSSTTNPTSLGTAPQPQPQPQQQPQATVKYEPGNVSSDQVRRLFGL